MKFLIKFVTLSLIFLNSLLASEDLNSIKIALVGPLTGKHKSSGQDMLRAINLKISQVNINGGIQGRQLELLTFDDQNNKELASKMAKEAVNSKAVAVIGHRWSSTTKKGIEVYKKYGMPAISGTATSTDLTKDNNWFFRAVPSNAQEAQTLAYYLKYILKKDNVTIIYDIDAFGTNLYEEFVKIANKIDLKVVSVYKVDRKSENLEQNAKRIIDEISDANIGGGIFFATHDAQTVPLIYYIKKNNIQMPLIGSSAIAKVSFAKRFDKYPMEEANKGYYTNDLYCAISMLFDIGGNVTTKFADDFKKSLRNKENIEVNAANASYYDATAMIVKALSKIDFTKDTMTTRKSVRDNLTSMISKHSGIKGVTGELYFKKDGNLNKKTSISIFKKQKLISSTVQINDLTNIGLQDIIKNSGYSYKRLKKSYPYLLKIKNGYLTKKEVVRVGFKLYNIKDINILEKSANLNFEIWFSSKKDLDLSDIYFNNAIDKIALEKPLYKKVINGEIYQRFQISGKFALDFDINKFKVNQHLVGFTLSSKRQSINDLVFIADILNMDAYTGKQLINKLKKDFVFDDNRWKIRDANFYQASFAKDVLADPGFLLIGISDFETPNINLLITFDNKSFEPKDFLTFNQSTSIFIIAILLSIFIVFLKRYTHKYSLLIYIVYAVSLCLILFSSEVFLLDMLNTYTSREVVALVALFINALWVFISAYLINRFLKEVIYIISEKRSGKEVPNLLQAFLSLFIYIIAFIIMVKFVFFADISSILSSLGMIIIITIWAAQVNISNIVSGVALSIHKTLKVGDWVEFAGYPEGIVQDIRWNKVIILCRDHRYLNLPSAVIADTALTNYSNATSIKQVLLIDIDVKYDPTFVKQLLLDATKGIDKITQDPEPETGIKELLKHTTKYKVVFNVKDYADKNSVAQVIWVNIWNNLNNANIKTSMQVEYLQIIDDKIEQSTTMEIN